MLILHPPTLHLVSIIVTVVAAGVSLLTWYHHREGPGLRGWTLALVLSSVGTFLFGLRGPDTSFRMILVADALVVAGFAAMWMSMHRFNNPGMTTELMGVMIAAIVTVFAALFTVAWQVAPAVRAQAVVFSLFISVLALAAAWEAWRGRRLDGLRSRPVAAVALAGIALARLTRALLVLAQGMDMIEPSVGFIAQSYALYLTTVCILVVTFGLVLMANERFERQYAMSTDSGRAAE